jgi:hypothetical protein
VLYRIGKQHLTYIGASEVDLLVGDSPTFRSHLNRRCFAHILVSTGAVAVARWGVRVGAACKQGYDLGFTNPNI